MVVALVALVAALAGTATALPGKGTVRSDDIKKNAVKSKHVKKNALKGADIKEASLGTVPSAEGLTRIPLTQGTPTAGATEAAARSAAAEVPLYSQGPFTVYGKCFSSGGTLFVETLIRTSTPGSLFDSREDDFDGGAAVVDFLNPDSPEADRQIDADDVGANAVVFENEDDSDFSALGPDGTVLRGWTNHGAKQGAPPFNGPFPAGDGCVWSGFVTAG